MLQLTDTVTSLAHDVSDTVTSLAHEVASKAQDAAQKAQDAALVAGERGKEWGHVAGKRGKQVVESGRQTLASVGVIPKPSHKGRNVLLLVVLAVLGFVAWKVLSGKKKDADGGSFPEAERIADKNSVRVA